MLNKLNTKVEKLNTKVQELLKQAAQFINDMIIQKSNDKVDFKRSEMIKILSVISQQPVVLKYLSELNNIDSSDITKLTSKLEGMVSLKSIKVIAEKLSDGQVYNLNQVIEMIKEELPKTKFFKVINTWLLSMK